MRSVVAVVVLACSVLAVPAWAAPGKHPRAEAGQQGPDLTEVVISAAERALIREYYRLNPQPMPGGSLPRGIQKRIAQGKPLPPGIAKKLPDGLYGQLPRRAGYDYRTVGADVLLVEVATGVIVDILRDVMR